MKIVNIVATVKLSAPLDLQQVHRCIEGTTFQPKVHWLQLRIPPDNTYIAFYKSGKFLVTAKSMGKLHQNVDTVLLLLRKIGIDIENATTEIHNLVICHNVDLKTSLEKMMYNLDPKKASYEPEQFPALIYKDWGVNFLVFSSGKSIITGAKYERQAQDAIENFRKLIEKV